MLAKEGRDDALYDFCAFSMELMISLCLQSKTAANLVRLGVECTYVICGWLCGHMPAKGHECSSTVIAFSADFRCHSGVPPAATCTIFTTAPAKKRTTNTTRRTRCELAASVVVAGLSQAPGFQGLHLQ